MVTKITILSLVLMSTIITLPTVSSAKPKDIIIMNNEGQSMKAGGVRPVVFNHLSHIEIAEKEDKCKTCHEDLFISKLNSNNISHGTIMNGNHCGSCHDPGQLLDCEMCHSFEEKK